MSNKTKKLVKRIVITVLIVLAAAGLFTLINRFFGNPVSYYLARRAANNFTASEFSGDGYEIADTYFNRDSRRYTVKVAVPGSADRYFTVFCDMLGKVTGDTSHCVKNGENTWIRLDEDFDRLVSAPLASFAHENSTAFGEIRLLEEYAGRVGMEYGIETKSLTPDMEYDLREYAEKAGTVVVSVWGEEVSEAHAAEILREIRTLLDETGVPFHAVDLSLKYKEKPSDKDIVMIGITRDEIGE